MKFINTHFYLHFIFLDTTASQSHLKPIPKEQAFLETFFYTIAQFAFDRARELAVSYWLCMIEIFDLEEVFLN